MKIKRLQNQVTVVNEKSNSYKRNTYADNAAMSRYKKEKFAGNCTAQDEYTGKTVKIHSDNEFDIANTDHIKPLKQGFEEVKYNYFVSDEQLKQQRFLMQFTNGPMRIECVKYVLTIIAK